MVPKGRLIYLVFDVRVTLRRKMKVACNLASACTSFVQTHWNERGGDGFEIL